jgi:hypothetical protein
MKWSSLFWKKSEPNFFAIMGSRFTEGFFLMLLNLRWLANLLISDLVNILPRKAAVFLIAPSWSWKEC